jgi:hypothetical protein
MKTLLCVDIKLLGESPTVLLLYTTAIKILDRNTRKTRTGSSRVQEYWQISSSKRTYFDLLSTALFLHELRSLELKNLGRLVTVFTVVVGLIACSGSPQSSVNLNETGSNGLLTPAAIYGRYVQALGGESVIRSHRSTTQRGRFIISAFGLEGQATIYSAAPNMTTQTIELPGLGTIRSGYNGEVGWNLDPLQGNSVLEGNALNELVERSDYYLPLNLAADTESETIEITQVNGEDAYRVSSTSASGSVAMLYFSVESGLMVRTTLNATTPLGVIPVVQTINSYGDYDGYKIANSISIDQAGQEVSLEIDAITFDDVPEGAFDLPTAIQSML